MNSLILAADTWVGPKDLGPVVAVAAVSALAGSLAVVAQGRGVLIPAVVIELLLGVVVGHQVLGLPTTKLLVFLSDVGLGLLFFFAGYEIDFQRIRGRPLNLALLGWAMSLAIAYGLGGILAAAGIVLSLLYTGSAMATTAIGTLIPILSDSGELRTRMGTNLLAAGAIGEFGPILLLTLILSGSGTLSEAMILVAFVAISVVVAVLAVRSSMRSLPILEKTAEKSSQIAVRWFFLLVLALVLLASSLGLDLLLGGFSAGVIARQVLGGREIKVFESKLTAVAFGVFVPFFFIVSGMQLDVNSLFEKPSSLLKVPLFFVLFLVIRGTPAMLLYRKDLDLGERTSLAFFSSTQLPLVLAITAVAEQTGHMRPTTAAALVAAAVLSTLIYPILGLRLRAKAAVAAA